MRRVLWAAVACATLASGQPYGPDLGLMFQGRHGERDSGESAYERGQRALEKARWDQALQIFSEIGKASGRADAALYWKAYALNKLGRRTEALTALAEIQKSFAASRWLNDAKALEIEVRQASGQRVSPESQSDDETKILVIQSLLTSGDPERALPMLLKVLQGIASPKVKEKAMFVVAQIGSPEARHVLTEIAQGKGNPDLQAKAVDYLGIFGGASSRQALADIYTGTKDLEVRQRVLRAYMLAGDKARLVAAAKSEPDENLRREAIRMLGLSHGVNELESFYATAPTVEAKREILKALFLAGAADRVTRAARSEKDPALREEAVHQLGLMGDKALPDLRAIYASDPDKSVKRAVLKSLFIQQDAKGLIEIARKEADPELKQYAIKQLSLVPSKETTEFMMEILNK
jgi:tetratricopeptide (TPR) repeat protein